MSDDNTLFPINPPESRERRARHLQQYMTPRWFAELMVARNFADLRPGQDIVLDPCTGMGAWLHAVPSNVEAFGVEIDPELAAVAQADTGRHVIVGDFRDVDVAGGVTVVVGNPPYGKVCREFVRRSHDLLRPGGRAGFLLPAHVLSFARPTLELLRGFETRVELVPRDLYPDISTPLVFATLTKATTVTMLGLAMYEEASAIRSMRLRFRRILEQGRRPVWREVLFMALDALGGEGTLGQIYRVVEAEFRPTATPFWRDYLRRDAGLYLDRIRPGVFRRPHQALAA